MSVAFVFLSGRLPALRIDDEFVLGQKLVCHLNGRLQIAAGIVAQVYHKIAETLLRERCQGNEQFGIGGLAETFDADIACGGIEHIDGRDAFLRNLASGNGEIKYFRLAVANDSDFHFGVFRSFQTVHCFFIGHDFSYERLAVDGYNLIAGQNPGPFGRSVFDNVLHVNGILADIEFDSDA